MAEHSVQGEIRCAGTLRPSDPLLLVGLKVRLDDLQLRQHGGLGGLAVNNIRVDSLDPRGCG